MAPTVSLAAEIPGGRQDPSHPALCVPVEMQSCPRRPSRWGAGAARAVTVSPHSVSTCTHAGRGSIPVGWSFSTRDDPGPWWRGPRELPVLSGCGGCCWPRRLRPALLGLGPGRRGPLRDCVVLTLNHVPRGPQLYPQVHWCIGARRYLEGAHLLLSLRARWRDVKERTTHLCPLGVGRGRPSPACSAAGVACLACAD